MKVLTNDRGQAIPAGTVKIGPEAFDRINHTEIRWLSGGGVMINSRGTIIMLDPVLEGFDMPLIYDPPLAPAEVKRIDGYCVTHIDSDHFSIPTLLDTKNVTKSFHSTRYVAEEMRKAGVNGIGHDIGEVFDVGEVHCRLTPAWHTWQNGLEEYAYREWKKEDYCGYYLETPDGSIWLPGDSRLIDEQLCMKEPTVILLDFSDDPWHISFEGAVKLCGAYPNALLLPIHWGSIDAPDFPPFNGDPRRLAERIVKPERLHMLLPGEAFIMDESRQEQTDQNTDWSNLTHEEKNHQLFLKQKELLDQFLEKGAISQAQHDKSLHDLIEKMKE